MSFSLPYSKKRRYLTGIDWVVGAMDHDARKGKGAGAISQAVLDVTGPLDPVALREAIEKVSQRFPLIHGQVSRDWLNLAPYWKQPTRSPTNALELRVVEAQDTTTAHDILTTHVNTPLKDRTTHLRFLLIHIGQERSLLGMVFDHRLLDAWGAEAMLRLIDLAHQGKLEDIAANVRTTEPAHLDHWTRRFASGKILTDLFHDMKNRSVTALKMPASHQSRQVKFVHESLTPEQSADFASRVGQEINVPIMLPSAAARAMDAMRQTFNPPPLQGEELLLFTTVTARSPGKETENLFFNPFAFLGFWADAKNPLGLRELAQSLRDQMFDYMRQNVPAAMHDAAALARIFPHAWVSHFSKAIGRGRLCSLYFACVRDTGFTQSTFLGHTVNNLTHTPLAFCPPSLNLCMTWHAGHFNLVLAYVENVMTDQQARAMLDRFKASLLVCA